MILEGRTPDEMIQLSAMAESFFYERRLDDEKLSNWAIYVNDRLQSDPKKKIRPRSKFVMIPRQEPQSEVKVVFENSDLLILDKPIGLPTQKTMKRFEDNLYDQVRHGLAFQKGYPQGVPYVGLHHRLDRDTSGLVLMTKQRRANKEVGDLFKNKKIQKEYLALVEKGELKPQKKWREQNYIGKARHPKHRFYFQVQENGDEAITDFEFIEEQEGGYLLRCFPRTGRTHQIRVHLSNAGFPIVGDRVYGRRERGQRLMLHARALCFPFQGQELKAETDSPWA